MTTGTNGAHVEVTVRMGDPLTVTDEPCHEAASWVLISDPLRPEDVRAILDDSTDEPCHRGRYFGAAIVREMLRAVGVRTCPDCYRYVGLAERTERPMRRKGSGWREAPPNDVSRREP